MLNWNNYQNELLGRVGEFAQLSPDTLVGYQALAGAGKKTGRLDEKTRELISLAVAVTTRCDGCIAIHTQAAKQAGASKEEIAEALGVAVALNAGAALLVAGAVPDMASGVAAARASLASGAAMRALERLREITNQD